MDRRQPSHFDLPARRLGSKPPNLIDLRPVQAVNMVYARLKRPSGPRDWLARGLALSALALLVLILADRPNTLRAPEKPEAPVRDHDPVDPAGLPAPAPTGAGVVTVSFTPVDSKWSATPPMTVGDMKFRLYITSSDLAFDYAQIDTLSVAGQPVDLATHLMTPVFLNSLSDCKAMIVIGTASQEGQATKEAQRAQLRSDFVQYQIWTTGRARCPIYTLNLGQARAGTGSAADLGSRDDRSSTAHQRRLIVASVLGAAPATLDSNQHLRAALHHALTRVNGLPVDLVRDYSLFELAQKH